MIFGSSNRSDSTAFPLTENPIAEGSRWVSGLTYGLDWSDIQTTTGKAFGTQTGSVGPPYNDSIALRRPLSGGSWGNDQDVRGRVFITSRSGWSGFHEVELLLRGTAAPHDWKMYEVLFSVVAGTTYVEIVRWKGPLGVVSNDSNAFVSLAINNSFAGLSDGDYIRATIVGYVITAYTSANGVSWTQQVTYDASGDATKYASGWPGLGHWNHGNGANNTYGLSQWSVTT